MKETLQPGIRFKFSFPVPATRTVPHLLPESQEFQAMPEVLASGYMVGIIEWACIQAINPHLDWPREQTVGVGFHLSHVAATPPGLTVTVEAELKAVEGRKLTFAIRAEDEVDLISEGIHERFVIDAARFNAKAAAKAERVKNVGEGLESGAASNQ
uniref:Thioesterase n=1 Tax=Desulfobacca acetoxidans TaxID=60893 RepID=A0A7C3Z163_9BACT